MSVFRFVKAVSVGLLAISCLAACQTQEEIEQEEKIAFEEELAQNVYGV